MRDLLRRRRLVNQRVQELNRLDKGMKARASTKRHIAAGSKSPGWRGVSKGNSSCPDQPYSPRLLAADLPELGEVTRLAPWSRDTAGSLPGPGAVDTVRRALYMSLSVIRSKNSALARFYQQESEASPAKWPQ